MPKLAQLGLLKFVLEFGLSHQHDLQQFLGKSLKVRQHPDFLKNFIRKVLCFIDDKYSSFSCAVSIKEPVVEPQQDLALCPGIARDSEICHQVVEKLRHVHSGIEDERGRHLLQPEPFEKLIDQSGLTGAHFAGEKHKPLATLDAVGQAGQSFFRVARQEQIARIRIYIKRIGSQAIKVFVHIGFRSGSYYADSDSL